MNPFDNVLNPSPYSELKQVEMGGVKYVDIKQLLDILQKRAILSLRVGLSAKDSTHVTSFQQGRYEEMRSLYEALTEK